LTDVKIGVSMLYKLGTSFEEMVKAIPENEVKYVEVVDDGYHVLDTKRAAELKDVGASYDVEFAVHAPFAGINIVVQDKIVLNATLRRLRESIVNAAALGCRLWVFHPGLMTGISFFHPEEDWVRNLECVRSLVKFAEDHGVKAGLENMMAPFVLKTVSEFRRFYIDSGLDVGLALDTGHANVTGELDGFLRAFSDKLVHVHVHDNLGKSDQHLGVGYGNIDWGSFAELVKKSGFDGILMIEAVDHIGESVQRLRKLFS
jgi:sugar phosphate isomerase/epimerase